MKCGKIFLRSEKTVIFDENAIFLKSVGKSLLEIAVEKCQNASFFIFFRRFSTNVRETDFNNSTSIFYKDSRRYFPQR